MNEYHHITVLLHEAVDALQIKPHGVYVDCTLGGGGHSQLILSKLNENGKLFVFDHDQDAWNNVPKDNRVILIKENFKELSKFLKFYKVDYVDGILADLGVSSHHFDIADRGFSIRTDGPLDMRMDTRQGQSAKDVIDHYSEEQLVDIFSNYGEVPNSKTLAKLIVEHRRVQPFNSTFQLVHFLENHAKGQKTKYLAKVFQALRIEVNKELESLEILMQDAPRWLGVGGRLVIISFHSLEDKIVKNGMKPEVVDEDIITGKTKVESHFKIITKRPIEASDEECARNPRSRSAKMRVAEKIEK